MHLSVRFITLAAVLLAGPLGLRAQSAIPAAGGWQKSIGVSVTPTWCYRTLSSSGDDFAGSIAEWRDGFEISRLGYDAGASLRLTHGDRLSLDMGLSYTSRGYQTKKRAFVLYDPDPRVPQSGKTKFNYQLLSVPLQASYAFGQGRLRGFVGGGVSLDFLLRVRSDDTFYYNDQASHSSSSTTGGYLRGNVTPRLTAGLRYALTPQYSLELAPVLQYSLLGSHIHAPISEHLYSAGVNVGLYRKF